MVNAVILERPAQRAGDVLLTDDLVEPRGPVSAVEGHGHVDTLCALADA